MVLTGAGISAESGLPTFRDHDGLWRGHRPQDLASPEAWDADPGLVLDFYNMRRDAVRAAEPNAAHRALVELERCFHVDVVTQNIDDLHERAGSSRVLHLHGEIMKARSQAAERPLIDLQDRNIALGDTAADEEQLRPAVVWFGETVSQIGEAIDLAQQADRVLVIGTSLSVWPAAGLLRHARAARAVTVVSQWVDETFSGIELVREPAATAVPAIVRSWLAGEAAQA